MSDLVAAEAVYHETCHWSFCHVKYTDIELGFMQDVCTPAADICMLPIIDMNLNDMSCVYSTLYFIEQQALKLNMPTACVTFDQLRHSVIAVVWSASE